MVSLQRNRHPGLCGRSRIGVLQRTITLQRRHSDGARSYKELPSVGTTKTFLSAGGVVLAAAVIAAALWSNRGLVRRTMWRLTLNRIDSRLQGLETLDERIQFLVDEGDIASAAVGIAVPCRVPIDVQSTAWAPCIVHASV